MEKSKDGKILTALKYLRKYICADCFNSLSMEERKGRGARNSGWVPPDVEKVKCCKCQKECVFLEDDK